MVTQSDFLWVQPRVKILTGRRKKKEYRKTVQRAITAHVVPAVELSNSLVSSKLVTVTCYYPVELSRHIPLDLSSSLYTTEPWMDDLEKTFGLNMSRTHTRICLMSVFNSFISVSEFRICKIWILSSVLSVYISLTSLPFQIPKRPPGSSPDVTFFGLEPVSCSYDRLLNCRSYSPVPV